MNDKNYEITTFRKDGVYSDGRHPDSWEFTSDLIDDLSRRDFTINAMAYNHEEGLIDPFDGVLYIEEKIINCVGDAKERFEEDALRILRAIRFSATLDFTIHSTVYDEIFKQYKNLSKISKERIRDEFCQMVISKNFATCLQKYKKVFSYFIPELQYEIGFNQMNPYHDYTVFMHTFHAIEHCDSDDLITRLAVLFHDIGKPHCYQDDEETGIRHFKGHEKVSAEITDKIMRDLKFDNDTRTKVVELVYYHDSTLVSGKKHIKIWLNKIGVEQFIRLLDVREADIKGYTLIIKTERVNEVHELRKLLNDVPQEKEIFSLKDLAINGEDIKRIIMISGGKEVGYWLDQVLQRVIDGELKNNRDDLIEFLANEHRVKSKK